MQSAAPIRSDRIIPEVSVDVAVSFQDIHDLHRVAFIPEEDHVVPQWEAADVGTQFRPGTAQCAGNRRQLSALLTETIDKALSNGQTTALSGDIIQDIRLSRRADAI